MAIYSCDSMNRWWSFLRKRILSGLKKGIQGPYQSKWAKLTLQNWVLLRSHKHDGFWSYSSSEFFFYFLNQLSKDFSPIFWNSKTMFDFLAFPSAFSYNERGRQRSGSSGMHRASNCFLSDILDACCFSIFWQNLFEWQYCSLFCASPFLVESVWMTILLTVSMWGLLLLDVCCAFFLLL